MLIGYMRVSSKSQDDRNGEARQRDALLRYGVEDTEDALYYDVMTGRSARRPALDRMLGFVRKGDVIVCSELSRIGRNTRNCLELIEQIEAKGARFVAIREGIDTGTDLGKFFLTIVSAFNELELSYINERCEQGREAARAAGRSLGGRPRKDPEALDRAIELFCQNDLSVRRISEQTGVSSSTIYREAKSRGVARTPNCI